MNYCPRCHQPLQKVTPTELALFGKYKRCCTNPFCGYADNDNFVEVCWVKTCENEICEQDKSLKPESAKFCTNHRKIVDEKMDGSPIEFFKWSVKNVEMGLP